MHLIVRNYRWFVAVSLAAFAVWCIVILLNPVPGFNYNIYSYFATLANQGVDIFALDKTNSKINPAYLDFTPANLALYRGIFWVQENYVPHFYHLYQLIVAGIAVALAFRLFEAGQLGKPRRIAVLVILCLSPAWIVLTTLSGEDKAIAAAAPLLLIALAARHLRLLTLAAFALAGVTGFGVLFLPLVALAWWRYRREHRLVAADWAAMLGGGLLLLALLALYYPDSAVMFENRTARELLPPFWYSIWRLAPDAYTPTAAKLVVVLCCLGAYLLYQLRRVSFAEAVMAVQFSFFLFANFLNHYRIVAFLFIPLLFLKSRTQFMVYLACVFVQLHVVLAMRALNIPFPQGIGQPVTAILPHLLLANSSLLLFLALFWWNALNRRGTAPALAASRV